MNIKITAWIVSVAIGIMVGLSGVSDAEVGVSDAEILIGSSLALEGHAGYLGTQTLNGFMAYIHEVNETGGVFGRKIRMTAYNDGYDPELCVKNTQKLIQEDKVFALSCYVGTPTSVRIIPIVEQANIPLVGLFTGAEPLREPVRRSIFNIRSSYYQETEGIIRHFWEDMGLRHIAVFYQNDDYGISGLKGVELALAKYHSKPVIQASYDRGSQNIGAALDTIRKVNPQAVVMIGVYGPCARFIQSAKWSGFKPYFHCISFVGANQLAYLLGAGKDSEGVIVTQVMPPPESDLPGVQEYRQCLEKHLLKNYPNELPNFVSLEGFMNAKVFVGVLKQAGKDLTRERFIHAAESLKNFDLGIGTPLSYSPQDHRGLDMIYFTIIRNGKYEIIKDWNSLK